MTPNTEILSDEQIDSAIEALFPNDNPHHAAWMEDIARPIARAILATLPSGIEADGDGGKGPNLGDGAERRIEAAIEKLRKCKLGCGPFGQCKAAMHGVPSECASPTSPPNGKTEGDADV